MKYVVVGTAGHIDHGKSALVRALTGTDPDRLEEEKRRGITIDLGFAHLDLASGARIAFVDVPGHERFVKNMLAGVGGIDFVLLVVAADESIKPQTREHFDICRLLGIRRGLIAITKADLAERDMLDLVKLELQDFVAGSFLEGAPMAVVSSKTGEGLDALKAELERLSAEIAPRPAGLPFRLPIDRAFVMKGFGAVVTGTLLSGTIEKDAEAELFPTRRRVRVRGIQVHNAPADRASAGQRTALNLAGIEAKEIARGMTLASPGLFEAASQLDVSLTLLPSARPVKNRSTVHFHSGTAEMLAQVALMDARELEPGAQGFAQLRLAEPGLLFPGDRFIIRQFSPVVTIGGGMVLDNLPAKHRFGDLEVIRSLRALEQGDLEARIELFVRQAGEIPLAALVAHTGLDPDGVLAAGRILSEKNRLRIIGHPSALFAHAQYFSEVSARLVQELEAFHAANPLLTGLAKEELRSRVAVQVPGQSTAPSPALFDAVLAALFEARAIEAREDLVRLEGRQIQLAPEEAQSKEQLDRAFASAGLAAPPVEEILAALPIDRPRAKKLLQLLLREKDLVKISEDLIVHRTALEKLKAQLTQRKLRSNRINVASFKEITGLSRKFAIPLLEYLDRERLTRREGDERVIL